MIKFFDCIALMQENNYPQPQTIIWENGKKYQIDRILEIKKCASTKGGGAGIRYKVRILNSIKFLFLKDYSWFVEID